MTGVSPSPDLRVSVITVCFQSAGTIERSLASVASQSWVNREHIVIDGGSTDGTIGIVERYRDKLACLVSEPDGGIYDAMNKGLARASGDVVVFLNSDDWYVDEHALETAMSCFSDPSVDVVFGDVDFVHAADPIKVVRRYRTTPFRPELLSAGWMPPHPALFIRKPVLDRVGPFKTSYRIAGDFDLVVRVFRDRSIRHTHLRRVLVRMQTGGASTAGLKSTILLNKEMMRSLRENEILTSWPRLLSRYFRKVLQFVPGVP